MTTSEEVFRKMQSGAVEQLAKHELLGEGYWDDGRGARWLIGKPGDSSGRTEIIIHELVWREDNRPDRGNYPTWIVGSVEALKTARDAAIARATTAESALTAQTERAERWARQTASWEADAMRWREWAASWCTKLDLHGFDGIWAPGEAREALGKAFAQLTERAEQAERKAKEQSKVAVEMFDELKAAQRSVYEAERVLLAEARPFIREGVGNDAARGKPKSDILTRIDAALKGPDHAE